MNEMRFWAIGWNTGGMEDRWYRDLNSAVLPVAVTGVTIFSAILFTHPGRIGEMRQWAK
jgi:hypothetical protein